MAASWMGRMRPGESRPEREAAPPRPGAAPARKTPDGPAQKAPDDGPLPLWMQAFLSVPRTDGAAAQPAGPAVTPAPAPAQAQRLAEPGEPAPGTVRLDGLDAGQPLDPGTRGRMEAHLQHDLSDVRLHTGATAERITRGAGAQALTAGNHVVISPRRYAPGTTAGDHLLAHELTHTVQQGRGGALPSGPLPVGPGADPTEHEAERVAHGLAGHDAPGTAVHAASGPAMARAVPENPKDLTDSTGKPTTKHEDPKLGEGYGHASAADKSNDAQKPTSVNIGVRVLHDKEHPLQLDGTPHPEDLYQEVPPVSAGPDSGVPVTSIMGNVDHPMIGERIDPDVIYIDNAPVVDDIKQQGFGDCYLLAAVSSMVAGDPGHIQATISGNAHAATANYYRFDTGTNAYVPVSISTDGKLVHDIDAHGELQGLHGAGFRVGNRVTRSEWYSMVVGTTLYVVRRDYYQAALWAPFLEKTYAVYAEKYGQYGGMSTPALQPNPQTDSAGATRSGYDIINEGGWASLVYGAFYGNAVQSHDMLSMSYAPGTNPVTANLPILQRLLQLQGQGLPAGQQIFITVWHDYPTAFGRTVAQIDAVLADPETRRLPGQFSADLRYLKTLITLWQAAQSADSAGSTAATKAAEARAKNRVARTARSIAQPRSWPFLHRESAPQADKDLLELLADIMNAGTDNDPGQRFIYTEHEYSVRSVVFRDAGGTTLAIAPAQLAAQAATIDANQSTVEMRNPHHTNEPDPHQKGTPPADDDGIFVLSLAQFFRNYSLFNFGVVSH